MRRIKPPTPKRSRVFALTPETLMNMLVHYTEDRDDDRVPEGVELREFLQSKRLPGIFCLVLRSDKWECPKTPEGALAPLDFRFAGSKVFTLGAKGSEGLRDEAREAPRRS